MNKLFPTNNPKPRIRWVPVSIDLSLLFIVVYFGTTHALKGNYVWAGIDALASLYWAYALYRDTHDH